ncbi:hypothetical protein AMECASPLE_034707 [Ameca splendens]|uniref:Uncharacterized protein n=1 Tax=Ameca splendens TaxID=208324 RepID=A0ABV0YUA2_9TELE
MDMVDQQVEEGLAQVIETEETPEDIRIEDTLEEAIEEEHVVEETPRQELSEAADVEEEELVHEPAAKRQQRECQLCEQRRAEINRLLQENRELRSELNKKQRTKIFLRMTQERSSIIQVFLALSSCYHCLTLLGLFCQHENKFHNFKWFYLH